MYILHLRESDGGAFIFKTVLNCSWLHKAGDAKQTSAANRHHPIEKNSIYYLLVQ